MEIAPNVRDFLVGMDASLTPDKETLLAQLQALHEHYLALLNAFSAQVSDLALSLSPEARVVAHKLRVRMYQDWRIKLMELIFAPGNENDCNDDCDCDCGAGGEDGCVCLLRRRLGMYKEVIEDFLAASPKIKSAPGEMYDAPDGADAAVDDKLMDQLFVFPEFLRSSALA